VRGTTYPSPQARDKTGCKIKRQCTSLTPAHQQAKAGGTQAGGFAEETSAVSIVHRRAESGERRSKRHGGQASRRFPQRRLCLRNRVASKSRWERPGGPPLALAVSVLFGEHDRDHALGNRRICRIGRVKRQVLVEIDPMRREGTESCPLSTVTLGDQPGSSANGYHNRYERYLLRSARAQ
jgi:hypothetical protein